MMRNSRHVVSVLVCVLILALFAVEHAQAARYVALHSGSSEDPAAWIFYGDEILTGHSDLKDVVADAIGRTSSDSEKITIFMVGGTDWANSGTILDVSKRSFTIQGLSTGTDPDPLNVTINGMIEVYGPTSSNLATLTGLRITGGGTTNVNIYNTANVIMERCYVTGGGGLGIQCVGSVLTLKSCSISHNPGDGIKIAGLSFVSLLNCTVMKNGGDGVDSTTVSSPPNSVKLINTVFHRNGGYGVNNGSAPAVEKNGVYFQYNTLGNATFALDPAEDKPPEPAVDPYIEETEWGELRNVPHAAHPLYDKGVVSSVVRDFEDQSRTSTPDIGADEFVSAGGGGAWTGCWVFETVSGFYTPYLGRELQGGQIRVRLNFVGTAPYSLSAFVVPIHTFGNVGPINPELSHRIVLNRLDPAGTSRSWALFEFPVGIQSLRPPEKGVWPKLLGSGDPGIQLDGLGLVYLVKGAPTSSPYIPPLPVPGQYFIFDTIAPRLDVSDTGLGPGSFITAGDSNDVFKTGSAEAHGSNTSGQPQGETPVPVDQGSIKSQPGGKGAHAFFNVFSDFVRNIKGNFEDFLTFKLNAPIVDPSEWGQYVSGFEPNLLGTVLGPVVIGGMDNPLIDQMLPAWWDFGNGNQGRLNGVEMKLEFVPVSGIDASAYFLDPIWHGIRGEWTIGDLATTGIDYKPGTTHFMLRFGGTDRAGNRTEEFLDPYHLWWMADEVNTRISPNREGRDVVNPTFSWKLDRDEKPNSTGEPYTLFTYGLWELVDPDTGVYTELVPLTKWSTKTSLGTEFDWSALENKDVLLVVLGMDEAGNVEPWPEEELDWDQGSNVIDVLGTSGDNWQRFYVSGPEPALDTSIVGDFWRDQRNNPQAHPDDPEFDGWRQSNETRLGALHLISQHPNTDNFGVAVKFTVRVKGDANMVEWELVRNGKEGLTETLADSVERPAGRDSVDIYLPIVAFDWSFAPAWLDPEAPRLDSPGQITQYVFRAWAVVDSTGDADLTPANYFFKIVPSTARYIAAPDSADDQPIKVFERQ